MAPEATAKEGALGSAEIDPQGDAVQWIDCGTGTVLRIDGTHCVVAPDDARLV